MTRTALVNGTVDDTARLVGAVVVGADGATLGHVDAVHHDGATGRAQWIAVRGAPFGTRVALVPLRSAILVGAELRVPFDGVHLRHAPHHDPRRVLSSADEAALNRYYGVDHHRSTTAPPTPR